MATSTTPPWTDAQIAQMWHDGISGNAERAQKELDAWKAAQPIIPVVPPTPSPPPAPLPPPRPAPPPIVAPPPSVPVPIANPERDAFLKQVNTQFSPGFEVGAVPSSLLDDTINSILTEQQLAAQQYLDRGQARGIYNDVGYNAGQAQIGNQASVGRSDLSSLGSTVIDKYRTNLDEVGDEAYSAARGFEPGGRFSLDPYISQYNDIKGRAFNNSAGDLRGLLGGRNYFDFANLSNRAGQAQGALNLRDTDVATALAERRRKNSISRGLGSQGAF